MLQALDALLAKDQGRESLLVNKYHKIQPQLRDHLGKNFHQHFAA